MTQPDANRVSPVKETPSSTPSGSIDGFHASPSDRFAYSVALVIAKRPCQMCCTFFLIILSMIAVCVVTGEMGFTEDHPAQWQARSGELTQVCDAVAVAQEAVDCIKLPTGLCPVVPFRSQRDNMIQTLTLTFRTDDSQGMFTPVRLQEACRIERLFLDRPEYPTYCHLQDDDNASLGCAAQATSVVELFYRSAGQDAAQCELLQAAAVDQVAQLLYTQWGSGDGPDSTMAGFFFGSDVIASDGKYLGGLTKTTRSTLALGKPFAGVEHLDPQHPDSLAAYRPLWDSFENAMMTYFDKSHSFFRTAYWSRWQSNDMDVVFGAEPLQVIEVVRIVNADMGFCLFSIFFVGCCLVWRTGSMFVGGVSLLQIVLSIPAAFFVYRFIGQVTFFQQLHAIMIFIILGIGADDVFVFSDAWHQADREHVVFPSHLADPETDPKMLKTAALIAMAYRRTMVAVFNTSFTTGMAFIVTSFSALMPISSMGWYAFCLVSMNYIFVITLTPATFAVWHTYGVTCCPCCPSGAQLWSWLRSRSRQNDETSTGPASTVDKDGGWFLSKFYIPVFGNLVVASICVLGLLVWGSLNIYWTTLLESPENAFAYFGAEHMMTRFESRMQHDFAAGTTRDYNILTLTFGINGIDREPEDGRHMDPWHPEDYLGIPSWDEQFDLGNPAAQEALRGICRRLRNISCSSTACQPSGKLVLPSAVAVSCFIDEFDTWNQNRLYSGRSFYERLASFRQSTTPSSVIEGRYSWKNGIGFVEDKLRFVQVQAKMTFRGLQSSKIREGVVNTIKDFIVTEQASAPDSLGPIKQSVPIWPILELETELVKGMFTGFAVCFPVAFLVLLVSTQNVIVSSYAIVTIAMIVCSVLGWCQAIEGWALGIAESLAGVIVIGLSVDYTLHMGHMYLEASHAGQAGRKERWTTALNDMGVTVLAGAFTTFVAGVSMQFCQMTFFTQMSTLIVVTVGYSLLYTMLFFMSLLRLVGPEREQGDIVALWRYLSNKRGQSGQSDTTPASECVADV